MRKLSCLTLIVGSFAIAGCGDGGGGDDAASPLDNALSYLPADTPFVVSIETDTKGSQFKAIGQIVEKFPFGDAIETQLEQEIEKDVGDFEQIQKALGNEFVVGSTDAKAFVGLPSGKDNRFVAAIQATDEKAIDDLLKEADAKEDGESNGAKIYSSSDDVFAVKDDVLIVAGTRKELETALQTREGDDHFSEEDFDAGTKGLPKDALIRVFVDAEQLLRAGGEADEALEVKWVKALREAGLALSFTDDQVAIDFRLATDPSGLTDADVPIATGATAPRVIDAAGEMGLALRDLSHVLDFAQATAKTIDPDGFSNFDGAKETIEKRLDLSLEDDVLSQLEGDLALSVDLDGKFGVRSELENPAEFERTLEKLGRVLPDLAQGAGGEGVDVVLPKTSEDFYEVTTADGETISFGVDNGVFVLSNDARKARSLAAAKTAAVPGGKGSLVLSSDAEQLARRSLQQAQGQLEDQFGLAAQLGGSLVATPLDQLTGSIESSTSEMSGSFKLTFDD